MLEKNLRTTSTNDEAYLKNKIQNLPNTIKFRRLSDLDEKLFNKINGIKQGQQNKWRTNVKEYEQLLRNKQNSERQMHQRNNQQESQTILENQIKDRISIHLNSINNINRLKMEKQLVSQNYQTKNTLANEAKPKNIGSQIQQEVSDFDDRNQNFNINLSNRIKKSKKDSICDNLSNNNALRSLSQNASTFVVQMNESELQYSPLKNQRKQKEIESAKRFYSNRKRNSTSRNKSRSQDLNGNDKLFDKTLKKIERRLKLSCAIYKDAQCKNTKHENEHLTNTFEFEKKIRKEVKEKINIHPKILKKYAFVTPS